MTEPLIREILEGFGASALRLQTAGLDGVRGGGVARVPALAVPQPADEPADRRLGRRRGAAAAVPARGAGGLPGDHAARVRGGAADLDRRGEPRRPDRGRGARRARARSTPRARSTTCRVVRGTSATLAGSDHIVPPVADRRRVHGAARGPGQGGGPRAGAGGRADHAAAGRRDDPRRRVRGHVRHDPGAHLRPGAAGQGRRGPRSTTSAPASAATRRASATSTRATPSRASSSPRAGREREFPRYGEPGRAKHPPADAPRDVLVIGGGPAGLKAAAVAAERGHRVTLVEAERRVGGQVRLAQLLPGPPRDRRGDHEPRGRGAPGRACASSTGVRADVAYVRASGARGRDRRHRRRRRTRRRWRSTARRGSSQAWDVIRDAERAAGQRGRGRLPVRLAGPRRRDAARHRAAAA